MGAKRRITVTLPADLLEQAQQASGTSITETVRTGLRLVAASPTYARLRSSEARFGSAALWKS
jgi:hypothetical protein